MNIHIKNAIENGRLILLLGAGASCNAKNKLGKNPPLGNELKTILSEESGLDISDDDSLSDVYHASKEILQGRIIDVLEKYYKHCQSSNDYKEIIKYPLPRIYTLNIDDSFEKAVNESDKYSMFDVYRRNDKINDFDLLYQKISLIKLNGDINVPSEGFIFSPAEYAEGSADEPEWYKELANDFHRYTFLFIGTKLDEPLFNHVIEKYKLKYKGSSPKSFLLTRNLSQIKAKNLLTRNIEYIQGDISDFTIWLKDNFPNGLSANDILRRIRPESFPNTNDLIVVNRANFIIEHSQSFSTIKNFYKGFKPTWHDILDGVPADLKETLLLSDRVINQESKLFLILGPAGSGKTTALKQIAMYTSDNKNNVFYMDSVAENLVEIVDKLERTLHEPYYIFIDRIADSIGDIEKILNNSNYSNAIFVGAENIRIWKDRGEPDLSYTDYIKADYSKISDDDVDPILDKLKRFGNWTRLEKMSLSDRRKEIIEKSKKQLLIGLLEATSGEGYREIIHREYSSIKEFNQKALLILTGLATLQRSFSSESTLSRALTNLNINESLESLIGKMEGIISYSNTRITTRHRIYIEELIYNFISSDQITEFIKAYTLAFCVYQYPIVINLKNKKDSMVYKGLINFKFLSKIIKDESKILSLYKYFEKYLELEGLFLLQYGLALRSYKKHRESLEKLRTARDAYPDSIHIEHAYAQQLLIISEEGIVDNQSALNYLEEARNILRKIETSNKHSEIDLYPIITLSRGHIKVLHSLKMYKEAREFSSSYYDELKFRFPKTHDKLIKETLLFLLKYRTTGKLNSKE
ncbi:SIR2 family protein [Pasteurella multocida]|uniref:P-loop NTPase n=1 Tax=Pasteurella multocida TaxID=747 RepID=UPI00292EA6A8|nr:SIR2 family protein [Pasteurella multocida]